MSESNGSNGSGGSVATAQPRTFQAAGHAWTLEISAYSMKMVRLKTGVELNKWTGKDTIHKMLELFSDVITFVDVLYVLCEDQAAARGVTDVAFGRGMRGDAIEQAAEAFWGAFADFCRSQGRTALLTLLAKMKQADARMMATATRTIEGLDVEAMAKEMEKLLTETETETGTAGVETGTAGETSSGTSNSSAASSPQSSGSTPTPGG